MKNLILPILVSMLLGIPSSSLAQQFAAGGRHSLVICADSTVQAWGYNAYGQLGNGNIEHQHSGTTVVGLNGITQVAGGLFHSLFVKSDGTVWSCGRNPFGNLGDGTITDKSTPIQILSLTNIIQVAGGGEHSLFLKNDSTVWACGRNHSGQLGDGTNISKHTPVQVRGLSGVIQVSAGAEFSLFLTANGSVWACGHNGFGQYGNGTNTSSSVPIPVQGLTDVIQLSAGEWHSLFVKSDGTAWSSGRNQYGQLGDGTVWNNNNATRISTLSGITQVEAGGIHSLFLQNDGTVWSCGLNSGGNNDGQLGDGTSVDRHSPVQVLSSWGSGTVARVGATREHSLFLTSNGVLWASGRNNYGQLGNGVVTGSNSLAPVLSSAVCNSMLTSAPVIKVNDHDIRLFPNPNSGRFFITSNTEISQVEVINILGESVYTFFNTMKLQLMEINVSNHVKGMYFLRIMDSNNSIITKKIWMD
jgi:alpha-tubulin suppressor-like RCC1 family protein